MVKPARCLVATLESDSHMWNLIYIQRWLQEHHMQAHNLGACTPPEDIVNRLQTGKIDLLVISTLNGHACFQGTKLIRYIRQHSPELPCVIGGNLVIDQYDEAGVRHSLLAAGFDEVFMGANALIDFEHFLTLNEGKRRFNALASGSLDGIPSGQRQALKS